MWPFNSKESTSSKTDELIKDRDDLEKKVSELEKEKSELSHEVAQLKLDRKIELEDIEHMMKMKGEKLDIELEKKVAVLEKKHMEKTSRLHEEFHKKTEVQMQNEIKGMQKMYGQILERLPNVNAKLTGKL